MKPLPQTAVILKFQGISEGANRLHRRDKAAACAWERTAADYGFNRIVIHEQKGGDAPEDSDFILIYHTSDRWARWGVARQGTQVVLWRCATGVEFGAFLTMQQALDTLIDPALRVSITEKPASGRSAERMDVSGSNTLL